MENPRVIPGTKMFFDHQTGKSEGIKLSMIVDVSSLSIEKVEEYVEANQEVTAKERIELTDDHTKFLEKQFSLTKKDDIPFKEKWNEMYDKLVDYKKELGDTLVPLKHVVDNNVWLGLWVITQRSRRSKMEETKWGRSRIKKLDASSFVWNKHTQEWNYIFAELVD